MKIKRNLLLLLGFVLAIAISATAIGANVVYRNPGTHVFDAVRSKAYNSRGTHLPVQASFSVGAESGDNIDTQITFKDGYGTAIAYPFQTYCWTSEDSAGAAYATTAATAVFSAVTNGTVESVTSGKSANVITSAAGLLGVRDTQTSNTVPDAYLCCKLALGATACSGAINH